MVAEHGHNAPVPQMAEHFLKVQKIVHQDRILQQTVEQLVNRSEAKRADLAKAEKSLAALVASQATGKSSCTQVVSDHEGSVKVFAEELKEWIETTQVLQSETDGADGHTYSLFQENASAALQTSTDFKGFDMMTVVRRLAEQEHFAALAQLRSRISAIAKFGADADNDPFVKVKDLITDFSRSQADASPETNQKSHCNEEKLLSVVYKNAVDNRRAAWRVITSVEQKEKSKGEEHLASHAREYVAKVENELQKIREGVLALTDKKLIRSPSTDESKAFYYKMKSDYYRYFAEFATGETKSKAGEDACDACVEANKIAQNDLAMTHPVRLAMDTKFLQSLKTRCSETNEEFDRRVVDRQAELKAVIDAIDILNSDTSFDTFDKTVSTDFLQMSPLSGEQALRQHVLSVLSDVMNRVVDDPVVQVPQIQVVEKTVEGPQLQIAEQTVETPEIQTDHSIQDRIQQRNVEQIIDTPVLPVVEEQAEASKVLSQNRVQQSSMEQTIANPAISLAEKTVEMLVTRTQEKTRHVVNTLSTRQRS